MEWSSFLPSIWVNLSESRPSRQGMSLSTSETASSTVATTGSTSLTPGTAPSGASGSTTAAVGSLGAPSTASTVNATLLSAVRSAVQEEVQAALNRAGIPLVAGGAPAEPASSSPSGKRLTSITCDGKDRSPRTPWAGSAPPSRSARERFPPPPHSSGRYSRERAHVDMGSHWQHQAGQP